MSMGSSALDNNTTIKPARGIFKAGLIVLILAMVAGLVVPPPSTAQGPVGVSGPETIEIQSNQERWTGCDEASTPFILLCRVYDEIKENFYAQVSDQQLVEGAARAVQEADLASRPREVIPPPCALPSPAFSTVCDLIDRSNNTSAAVWAATEGMVRALNDPISGLLSPSQYQSWQNLQGLSASYVGIGVRVGIHDGNSGCRTLTETCRLTVTDVIEDSGAEEAGLMPGDVILKIGGVTPQGDGCGLDELDQFSVGMPVEVTIQRGTEVIDYIIPARLLTPGVAWGLVVDDNIGYIRLHEFDLVADRVFSEQLEELLDEGIDALVIDLRSNPGGYLGSTQNIASLFLDDQDLIARLTISDGSTELVRAERKPQTPDAREIPLTVVVNNRSASGSEMLALALRHYGHELVGTTTFGKTTGQTTKAITDRSGMPIGALRLSIIRWVGPDNSSATGGIVPDRMIEFATCAHPVTVALEVTSEESPSAGQEPPQGAFDDDNGKVAEEALNRLAGLGVFEGTECGARAICPNAPIARWTAAVWIIRALEERSYQPEETVFADVVGEDWWSGYVQRLFTLGATNGCATDPARFCPDQVISRAQMAALLVRILGLDEAVSAGFTDTVGITLESEIDSLAASGITTGCSTNPDRFCPKLPLTRGQMALFIDRALQELAKGS